MTNALGILEILKAEGIDPNLHDFVLIYSGLWRGCRDGRSLAELNRQCTYETEQVKLAELELAEVESWDDAEAQRQAEVFSQDAMAAFRAGAPNREERAEARARVKLLRNAAMAWQPIEPAGSKLKSQLTRELGSTLEYDLREDVEPVPVSGSKYKEDRLLTAQAVLKSKIKYAEQAKAEAESVQSLAKDIDRLASS